MSSPRAVIVTGGGTGIVAAVARLLTSGGDRVAILGRRPGPLRAVAAVTGAVDVVCDVSDAAQVAASVATVLDRFGRLDGLVLNAGIMLPGGVADLAPRGLGRNGVGEPDQGTFHVARAALPHLLAQRGAIVAVASVAALRAASRDGRVRGDQGGAHHADPIAGGRSRPTRACGPTWSAQESGASRRWRTRR